MIVNDLINTFLLPSMVVVIAVAVRIWWSNGHPSPAKIKRYFARQKTGTLAVPCLHDVHLIELSWRRRHLETRCHCPEDSDSYAVYGIFGGNGPSVTCEQWADELRERAAGRSAPYDLTSWAVAIVVGCPYLARNKTWGNRPERHPNPWRPAFDFYTPEMASTEWLNAFVAAGYDPALGPLPRAREDHWTRLGYTAEETASLWLRLCAAQTNLAATQERTLPDSGPSIRTANP